MIKRLKNGWSVRVVACVLVGILLSIFIRGGGFVHAADQVWTFYPTGTISSGITGLSYDDDDGDFDVVYGGGRFFRDKFRVRDLLNNGLIPNINGDILYTPYWHRYASNGEASYSTLARFDAPYTGWYKICMNTPRGQSTSIGCYMHHGVEGSYGCYLQGEVYLNQGEILLMLIGDYNDQQYLHGPQSSADGDTSVDGHSGGSIYVMKYKNSDNLQRRWTWVTENYYGNPIPYNGTVLAYWDPDSHILNLPNCDLLFVCGGGNGSGSYCTHTGRDSEDPGRESGYYFNENLVRNVAGVHGIYSDEHTQWQDPTTISSGYVSKQVYDKIAFEGYYKPGISNGTLSVSDALFSSGGNDRNECWVKIVLNGNYIHYVPNYPSGVVGSGEMLSTRLSYGIQGVLRRNTFDAGEDWDFKGWATSVDRANQGIVDYVDQSQIGPITNDTYLYAVWKPAAYYITYDKNAPNGNTVYGTMEPKEVENGLGAYLDENKYSCTGYIWKGWGSSSGTTTVVWQDKGWVSPREDDITVYAVWEPIVYNVNIFNNKPAESTSNIVQIK